MIATQILIVSLCTFFGCWAPRWLIKKVVEETTGRWWIAVAVVQGSGALCGYFVAREWIQLLPELPGP